MRILHIMAGGKHGGAETAFVDMCIAQHEAGQTIEVATRKNSARVSRLEKAGIKVHTLPFGGKVDLYTPLALTHIIKAFKPHITQNWMSRASRFTPRWDESMKIPRYLNFARLGTPYKMKYYANVEYFAAITPDIRDYIIEHGIFSDHVRHLNNFAEVEPVDAPIDPSDYGADAETPIILGLGRLHPDKAFDTLIKVAKKIPKAHFWIAGEGPQREELETLIKELDLEERVKLLGWRTDRAALLQAADVCAFISRNEGFGTVFVQCWAQKTPVVACNADGPRQFIRHEADGLISEIDNEDAIQANIERLLTDSELCQTLIKNGFERYKNEFTKDASVKGYIDFYKYALERENIPLI
ncbi:MAG: hypothetical protein CBB87_07960 [Micavibrio sp. TMED27]|nr:hypothetical protein [Micavibrio sp.]OUT90605.1 MAG: hypothetical protein CBB87_07960 [Micavibrio sp. TMED27]